jgi:hypothetical protein
MDNMATELATSHFPKPAKGASPKPLYRIKVYQENSMDVIAIKAKHRMSRAQLLDKVFVRVQAAAPDPSLYLKPGKLLVKEDPTLEQLVQ